MIMKLISLYQNSLSERHYLNIQGFLCKMCVTFTLIGMANVHGAWVCSCVGIIHLISTFKLLMLITCDAYISPLPQCISQPCFAELCCGSSSFSTFPHAVISLPLFLPWLFSGFPDEGVIGHFPISARPPERNPYSTAINQPGETLEWMGKAARSGLYMNESANPWHSVLENGFSCHTLREANWAVMRGTSPLSLTAGNSITSHANWPGLSFLEGNPGNP